MSGFDLGSILKSLFARDGKSLGHVWIPDGHVVDANNQPVEFPKSYAVEDAYVMISLAEMFLKRTRVLWREFYPVVHSFITYGNPQAPLTVGTVAGPGQLKDIGTANLDKVIPLAFPLAGPIVYDGQNIEALLGLYAVPAKDGAAILINTLSQLSSIVPQLAAATQVAGVLKTGTEQMLGIDGTQLKLGLHNSFFPPTGGQGFIARPGFAVAVSKAANEVDANQLWVVNGRLKVGRNPVSAQAPEEFDYMLIQFYAGPPRVNIWGTIPSLADHTPAFENALKADAADRKTAVNLAFSVFEAELAKSRDLTKSDKGAVRALVAQNLKDRVAALEKGSLFELKSGGTETVEAEDPTAFRPFKIGLPEGQWPQRAAGLPIW
ncbi:hypothetical protein [Rhizobium leguminosarum]|uniref:hypothetical protein n=1 Tax=Rhizobium leguminosarum TaxID=384 RepID=UPI00143F2DFC|nr:hypothetical protein [Rhizobium leguminosarum]NKL24764.1 hypothetical protein [Rhizobium leguminosarum bv. viciae]